MSAAPPKFADLPACAKCNVSFGLLTRKHHCRNCGQTFCQSCSSKTAPLPHFGFDADVRVCDKCFEEVQARPAGGRKSQAGLTASPQLKETPPVAPAKAKNCTCGMPLCICPPDQEETKNKQQQQQAVSHAKQARSSTGGTREETKQRNPPPSGAAAGSGAGGGGESTPFFSSSFSPSPTLQYDLGGNLEEQCREAIKAGDVEGLKKLLDAGANPSFVDHTGSSLLHMAAMFNRLEVVRLLMSKGADIDAKNKADESPIDVAPPALQFKMREIVKQRAQS